MLQYGLGQSQTEISTETKFKPTVIPTVAFQVWSSYTIGQEVYQEGVYRKVDDRLNTQIRRGRVGLKGALTPAVTYRIGAAFDQLGRDVLSGTYGTANNGSAPRIRLLNAAMLWHLSTKNDLWNLTIGYQVPRFGRESITAAFSINSFEKSGSQTYYRKHIVGLGHGRALGFNMGGQFNAGSHLAVTYDVGFFNPQTEAFGGNSTGIRNAMLFTSKIALHIGDAESPNYALGHKVNYFGARKGITLGASAAGQGATDQFDQNNAWSIDLLANWGPWSIGGDWTWMSRTGMDTMGLSTSIINTKSQTGYLRLGYTIELKSGHYFEPSAMFMQFKGAMEALAQQRAETLGLSAGSSQVIDLGFNYYFSLKFKLSLHYHVLDGKAGDASAGSTINRYFNQSGVGAIRRGNWLGMGVLVIL